MSPTTWTPTALASEARPWAGRAWRMVEAQHVVATMKLVDGADEQALLEDMLDGAKPPLPRAAHGLHYLLATPFRYPPLPRGSRFRAAGEPGVFYGAEEVRTAAAELGYWRWRFLKDAPDLSRLPPVAHTAFRASARTDAALDLRVPPLDRDAGAWTDPDSYAATQALARAAREAKVEAIVYASVRDAERGMCVALLAPTAFAAKAPDAPTQTWWLSVQPEQAIWVRDAVRMRFGYSA
jgi:hypothetical protein